MKVIRHRCKVPEFESDLLTANEHKALQSGENLQTFKQWGTITKCRWIFPTGPYENFKKKSLYKSVKVCLKTEKEIS